MTTTTIRAMRAEDAKPVLAARSTPGVGRHVTHSNRWRDVVFIERRSPHVN